jgi:uncharacterized protein
MAFEMGPETRQVQGTWDISTYNFRLDDRGLKLLTEGFKDKKIQGIKCSSCGTVYVPGPTFCRKCFIDIDDVVEVKDEGEVMSFSVEMADVHGTPLEQFRVTAMIKPDGCDTWMVGTITGIDWHDVKIGMRVKAIWAEERSGIFTDIDRFEPV